jgi:osmotically-inducible protein OsmY
MKQLLSDRALQDAVVEQFADDSEVAVAKHISVTARAGAVTLGGHVETYHEKLAAVRARRLTGVHAVTNLIVVSPASFETECQSW